MVDQTLTQPIYKLPFSPPPNHPPPSVRKPSRARTSCKIGLKSSGSISQLAGVRREMPTKKQCLRSFYSNLLGLSLLRFAAHFVSSVPLHRRHHLHSDNFTSAVLYWSVLSEHFHSLGYCHHPHQLRKLNETGSDFPCYDTPNTTNFVSNTPPPFPGTPPPNLGRSAPNPIIFAGFLQDSPNGSNSLLRLQTPA